MSSMLKQTQEIMWSRLWVNYTVFSVFYRYGPITTQRIVDREKARTQFSL